MTEIHALKDEIIYETTLASGLRVAIHPKPEFHNVLVSYQVGFGGVDLDYDCQQEHHQMPAGVAHFLEHLMFHNNHLDLAKTFADLGAEVNAYTSKSLTAYKFKTINHLDALIDVFMNNFRTFDISDELIEKERKIITYELTMSEDSVHVDMNQKLLRLMYHDPAMNADVGGTVKDVRAIDRATLESAFKTFYHPKNCTLVVTGNVNPEALLKQLEDHPHTLDQWPDFYPIKRCLEDGPRRIHHVTKMVKDANENMISFALKIPADFFLEGRREALHIGFGSVVANAFGLGSKTFDYLEKEKLMNVSFFTKMAFERDYGYFEVFIQTNKVKRYKKTMQAIFEAIGKEPLDEAFFDVNKKNILGNYITVFDSLSRVHDLLCNVTDEGLRIDHYLRHILDLKFTDLNVYQRLFVPENIYSVTYLKARKNR